jgi:CheY-like chemotaxis protein
LPSRHSVLVVDPLEETHEVLRTALGERGVEIVATRHSAQGLALARQCEPHLIVLDLDSEDSTVVAGRLAAEAASRCTPLLVLGTAKRAGRRLAGCPTFSKPYHYAALIRKIEELLGEVVDGARRRDAKAA